ncbi:MAG: enoyl-CoA hydratase/isomerase family protein [Planctomycetota bacterium]|nr:enoyl-CoA hydratase/isomerase family protein [Planctomycetota bacterium]
MPVVVETQPRGELMVTTVTLDSAPLNVLDLQMCSDLHESLQLIRNDDEARIVVIRGAHQEFCSGTDISQHTPDQMPALLPAFHDCLRRIYDLDAIVIAAIEGRCLGGGLELALACDRIVAERSSLLGLPEIHLGCYPPAGIVQLLERRGYGEAVRMVLSGQAATADSMARSQIIDVLTDDGTLDRAIDREIDGYSTISPSILAITIRQFHRVGRKRLSSALLEIERDYLSEVLPHPDSTEGIEAFLAKRKPQWADRPGLVGRDDVAL